MRSIIRRGPAAICAVTAALIADACAGPSTQVEQAWAVKSAPAMHNAVTLFVGQSLTLKHSAEDKLAADLSAKGITATPAYMVLGDNVTTIEQAREKLAQTSYDGLVTMRILDREQSVESYPDTGYWGGWGYYGWNGYADYMYTETKYRVETAAWDLRSNKLVWSAMTSTVDPDNARELVHDTSQVVSSRIRHVPGPG